MLRYPELFKLGFETELAMQVRPVSPTLWRKQFVVDQPKGSYREFAPPGSTYPLKGVTYPTDYGYLPGYQGEDESELDLFRGTGKQHGSFRVRRDDVPGGETKFMTDMTPKERRAVLRAYRPVLQGRASSFDEAGLWQAMQQFKLPEKRANDVYSDPAAQQPRRRRTSDWLKPVLGLGAAGGLAYMGDRYLNHSNGMTALKQLFAKRPATPAAANSHSTTPEEPINVNEIHQAVSDTTRNDFQGQVDQGLREQWSAPVAPAMLPTFGLAVPKLVGNAVNAIKGLTKAQATAANSATPLARFLHNPVSNVAAKVVGPLSGAINGGSDAVAEYGLFGMPGSQPAEVGSAQYNRNRNVGMTVGGISGLHPVGAVGNMVLSLGGLFNNYSQSVVAAKDSLADQHGKVIMNLGRASRSDPAAATALTEYLAAPKVKQFLADQSHMERYPALAQMAKILQQRGQSQQQGQQ